MNDFAEKTPTLWESLEGFRPKALFVIRVLWKAAPLVQIALATLALLVGIWYGNRWRETAKSLSELLISTLGSRSDMAAQPYTGFETYLLSIFPRADQHTKVPQDVQESLARIASVRPLETYISAIVIANASTNGELSSHSQYLTLSDTTNAFLFAPGNLLPRKYTAPPALSEEDKQVFLASGNQLAYDIRTAAALQPNLREFDSKTIDNRQILQSYFLTESGVLIIRKSGTDQQQQYYQGLLPAYRFHPERNYFWPTVEHVGPQDEFDFVSEAYIDSTGNGPVRTYCKRISKIPARAVCLDISLWNGNEGVLVQRIKLLNEKPYQIDCTVSDQGEDCKFPPPAPPNHDSSLPWLKEEIVKAKADGRLAQVFGRVVMRPCEGTACDSQIIEVAVPIYSNLQANIRTSHLYWARINLQSVQQAASRNAFVAAVSLSTFVLLVCFLGIDYRSKNKQQKEVLKSVCRVMEEAPTPFAWTDEHNEFVYANRAFTAALQYDNLDDLKKVSEGRKRTFRELLTVDSLKTYDDILKNSQEGKSTDPYDASFVGKGGRKIRARVYGERVPFPGFTLTTLPHRFGVFASYQQLSDTELH